MKKQPEKLGSRNWGEEGLMKNKKTGLLPSKGIHQPFSSTFFLMKKNSQKLNWIELNWTLFFRIKFYWWVILVRFQFGGGGGGGGISSRGVVVRRGAVVRLTVVVRRPSCWIICCSEFSSLLTAAFLVGLRPKPRVVRSFGPLGGTTGRLVSADNCSTILFMASCICWYDGVVPRFPLNWLSMLWRLAFIWSSSGLAAPDGLAGRDGLAGTDGLAGMDGLAATDGLAGTDGLAVTDGLAGASPLASGVGFTAATVVDIVLGTGLVVFWVVDVGLVGFGVDFALEATVLASIFTEVRRVMVGGEEDRRVPAGDGLRPEVFTDVTAVVLRVVDGVVVLAVVPTVELTVVTGTVGPVVTMMVLSEVVALVIVVLIPVVLGVVVGVVVVATVSMVILTVVTGTVAPVLTTMVLGVSMVVVTAVLIPVVLGVVVPVILTVVVGMLLAVLGLKMTPALVRFVKAGVAATVTTPSGFGVPLDSMKGKVPANVEFIGEIEEKVAFGVALVGVSLGLDGDLLTVSLESSSQAMGRSG